LGRSTALKLYQLNGDMSLAGSGANIFSIPYEKHWFLSDELFDEFLELIESEDLIQRFDAFLEQCPDNILTPTNMPWFDLGDIPSTHSFMRNEQS
jgi:hypothetical protein